jgi:hypothetical protein
MLWNVPHSPFVVEIKIISGVESNRAWGISISSVHSGDVAISREINVLTYDRSSSYPRCVPSSLEYNDIDTSRIACVIFFVVLIDLMLRRICASCDIAASLRLV